jgi:hypothetical protein
LATVLESAIDLLTKYSIPLYVNDEYNRPDQFGTGFFVRAGESHFLVSAAHVLDVARTRKVFYYATPEKLRWLSGRVLTTGRPETLDDDMLDVGVMRLTGDALPPYPAVDKFPVEISYLRPKYLPRLGKHYVIVGFPATKSRIDSRDRTALVSPYAYRSDSAGENVYAKQGVDAETHLVLPLDLRKGRDAGGLIRAFPKPQGMSGSPIVVLYGDNEETEDSLRGFPVVAVGTRYCKSAKVLIGTDIRFAVEMIDQFGRE